MIGSVCTRKHVGKLSAPVAPAGFNLPPHQQEKFSFTNAFLAIIPSESGLLGHFVLKSEFIFAF